MSDTSKIQFRVSDDDLDRWDEFVDESMLVSNRSELIRRAVGVYIQENTHFSVSDGLQVNDSANKLEQGDTEGDIQEAIDLLDYISAEIETVKNQTQQVDNLASEDDLADVEQSLRLAINNTDNNG
jgi:hypothetical protein